MSFVMCFYVGNLPTFRLVGNFLTCICFVLRILASEALLFIVVEKNDGILAKERDGDNVSRRHYHHEEIDQCPYYVDSHQRTEEYNYS